MYATQVFWLRPPAKEDPFSCKLTTTPSFQTRLLRSGQLRHINSQSYIKFNECYLHLYNIVQYKNKKIQIKHDS